MGKKSSLPSRLTFEESEQNDALMEKIFAGVDDVPDKEPALEIPPSESSLKNPGPLQQTQYPVRMLSWICTEKHVKNQL